MQRRPGVLPLWPVPEDAPVQRVRGPSRLSRRAMMGKAADRRLEVVARQPRQKIGGCWYSTVKEGECGADELPQHAHGSCCPRSGPSPRAACSTTSRAPSSRTMARASLVPPACNVTSPCWVRCFMAVVLGPEGGARRSTRPTVSPRQPSRRADGALQALTRATAPTRRALSATSPRSKVIAAALSLSDRHEHAHADVAASGRRPSLPLSELRWASTEQRILHVLHKRERTARTRTVARASTRAHAPARIQRRRRGDRVLLPGRDERDDWRHHVRMHGLDVRLDGDARGQVRIHSAHGRGRLLRRKHVRHRLARGMLPAQSTRRTSSRRASTPGTTSPPRSSTCRLGLAVPAPSTLARATRAMYAGGVGLKRRRRHRSSIDVLFFFIRTRRRARDAGCRPSRNAVGPMCGIVADRPAKSADNWLEDVSTCW